MPRRATILPAIVLLSTFACGPALAQVGGTFVLTEHDEAGSIFDPADGSLVRAVSAVSPGRVLYEEHNFFDQPTGILRRCADLSSAPPVVTGLEVGPVLFAGDGISPFPDSTLYHPTMFDLEDILNRQGLYVITDHPTGGVEFFVSFGSGFWIHEGTPVELSTAVGEGIIDILRVDDPGHAEGLAIVVYYQTISGAVRAIVSDPAATGTDKYVDLDPMTDVEVLAETAVPGGFAATGSIERFPSGDLVFFFVPVDRSCIGIAESVDPLSGWQVTRGAADPLLSTAGNASSPDPARSEVLELSLFPVADGVEGYYAGAIPGLNAFSRSLGRVRFESALAMDPSVGFRRGDPNEDASVNIVDAIFTLQYLFSSGTAPACLDAADANDDGGLDILDPVYLLAFLFAGGAPLPAPATDCARDLTVDPIPCVTWSGAGCTP